jgi:hypothetical protein
MLISLPLPAYVRSRYKYRFAYQELFFLMGDFLQIASAVLSLWPETWFTRFSSLAYPGRAGKWFLAKISIDCVS